MNPKFQLLKLWCIVNGDVYHYGRSRCESRIKQQVEPTSKLKSFITKVSVSYMGRLLLEIEGN